MTSDSVEGAEHKKIYASERVSKIKSTPDFLSLAVAHRQKKEQKWKLVLESSPKISVTS